MVIDDCGLPSLEVEALAAPSCLAHLMDGWMLTGPGPFKLAG